MAHSYTEFWFRCECWNVANHTTACVNIALRHTWWLVSSIASHHNENHVVNPRHVVMNQCEKAAGEYTSFRQRAVMDFLVKIRGSHVYARLQRSYEDACMSVSSVRRQVKPRKDGNKDGAGQPEKCPYSEKRRRDQWVYQRDLGRDWEVAAETGIGQRDVQETVGSLAYRKVCARFFPRYLTEGPLT